MKFHLLLQIRCDFINRLSRDRVPLHREKHYCLLHFKQRGKPAFSCVLGNHPGTEITGVNTVVHYSNPFPVTVTAATQREIVIH